MAKYLPFFNNCNKIKRESELVKGFANLSGPVEYLKFKDWYYQTLRGLVTIIFKGLRGNTLRYLAVLFRSWCRFLPKLEPGS